MCSGNFSFFSSYWSSLSDFFSFGQEIIIWNEINSIIYRLISFNKIFYIKTYWWILWIDFYTLESFIIIAIRWFSKLELQTFPCTFFCIFQSSTTLLNFSKFIVVFPFIYRIILYFFLVIVDCFFIFLWQKVDISLVLDFFKCMCAILIVKENIFFIIS